MTPQDLTTVWTVFVSVGVGIGVVVAFIKGVQYLFEVSPTGKLSERVKKIEDHDTKDLERFNQLEQRIENLESKVNESNNKISRIDEGIQRLGKSQILLLRHFATGNGQKEMAEEANDLTDYFIGRRYD